MLKQDAESLVIRAIEKQILKGLALRFKFFAFSPIKFLVGLLLEHVLKLGAKYSILFGKIIEVDLSNDVTAHNIKRLTSEYKKAKENNDKEKEKKLDNELANDAHKLISFGKLRTRA